MARIRSLKPEFWLDRKLARKLSRDERMLYMGLWNQADEHGRALGDPVVVKGAIFPYDDDLTIDVIDRMLDRLDSAGGVVQRYEVDGDPYLFLRKLGNHQRLEPNKSKSRHPEPPPVGHPQTDSEVVSDQSETIVARSEPIPESGNGTASFESGQDEEEIRRTATIVSDESAQDPREKALLYGTGSMLEGGRGADSSAQTEDPPTTFCPKHPGGTSEPCGQCAERRKARVAANLARDQRAEAEAAARAERERLATHQAAEVRARAIAACDMCDETGWADGRSCDHDPQSFERDRRGIAQALIVACRRCDETGHLGDGTVCDHKKPGKGARGARSADSPERSPVTLTAVEDLGQAEERPDVA